MQDLDQIRITSDNDGGEKIFNTISCIHIHCLNYKELWFLKFKTLSLKNREYAVKCDCDDCFMA